VRGARLRRNGERTEYKPGTFCWVDLSTPDHTAAKSFYMSLFGWEATTGLLAKAPSTRS